MNYTKLFYWLVVADNAKSLFVTFIVIFTTISIGSTLVFIIDRDWDDNLHASKDSAGDKARRWMWYSFPFMILFWSLYVFTPSKKDALLIVAGGQTLNFLTTDSTAKQIPHELSSFVVTQLKNMAQDAKVDLNINEQKEKILKEAKTMTPAELIDKMKTDSSFKKIILDK